MRTCVPSKKPMENDHEEEACSSNPRTGEEEEGPWANWPVSLVPLIERKLNSDEQCLKGQSEVVLWPSHTCLPMNT